jgi:FkbM family methyltransferase
MRRRVGPAGRVFAFEPQPRQVAYLREAFATLPFENVVLVPMAVSDRVGLATLHIPPGPGQTHGAKLDPWGRAATVTQGRPRLGGPTLLEVDVTTLDDFFADQSRQPDFLKIDVEGHELAVLHGGRNLLETYRPRLLVECEARHRADSDVRPVFEFLASLGYEGTFFHTGRRRPLAEFDPAVHQHLGTDPARRPRGYVNNFAFVPLDGAPPRALSPASETMHSDPRAVGLER